MFYRTNLELVVKLCPGSNHICNQGSVGSTFMMQIQKTRSSIFWSHKAAVWGPVLYSAYASTLQEVVPLDPHGYANDHGLKTNFFPVPECEAKAIADTEKCLTNIKTWMDHNQLCMNNAKTESILFGSRQQLRKCMTKNLSANVEEISQSNCINYLGTWMDQELSFSDSI